MARTLRTIAEGIYFGEGPRWHDDRLWFSDFHAHKVYSVAPEGGALRVEVELDDQPSGLGWMPDGSLLVVSMRRRELWRRWPDGRLTRHAELGETARFSANDMVVDREGRAYVGNFGFDLDTALRERGAEGVIADHTTTTLALVQPDGSVSVAAEGLSFPNGTVITPDGQTLIVAETLGGRLSAFDIAADGSLSGRRVWAETWPRIADGIALDADGAIWVANPIAPECVRIAAGGAVLEVIETPVPCFACMLGGADGRTLFMLIAPTSDGDIARAAPLGKLIAGEVDSPRAGWP